MEILWQLMFLAIACSAIIVVPYLFLVVVGGTMLSKKRDLCPACGQKTLKLTNSFRVNPPPNYNFHRCESCESQFIKVTGTENFLPRIGSNWENHPGWERS